LEVEPAERQAPQSVYAARPTNWRNLELQ
jgi:hypothetical protein